MWLVAACGHPPSRGERWLADRGRESATWHVCAQIGAALRAKCNGATACEAAVTDDLTHNCYAARYAAATERARPDQTVAPETSSPCFWDRVEPHPASPAAYATQTCELIVEAPLRPACVAEVRTIIETICARGGGELTGAGP